MTTKLHLFALCTFAFATQAQTNPPSPDCRVQQVEGARVEMCLFRGASFQHDRYMLRFDGDVIFVLTDDFAERVELEHTLLDGPAIEYRLSGQDAKTVKLVGGVHTGDQGQDRGGPCLQLPPGQARDREEPTLRVQLKPAEGA